MAYVNITGGDSRLASIPALLEGWLDDLVTNRGWTDEYETNVGLDNYERWVSRPGADTVNGDELVFGVRVELDTDGGNTGPGDDWDMVIMGSRLSFAEAQNPLTVVAINSGSGNDRQLTFSGNHNLSVGDRCTFDNSIVDLDDGTNDLAGDINGQRLTVSDVPSATVAEFGQLNNASDDTYDSGGACIHAWGDMKGCPNAVIDDDNNPSGVNFPDATTDFIQAWFLTPSDTGSTPADHQYAYCVVEIAPGIYRAFGFGEIIKIGTWEGGAFVLGDWVDPIDSDGTGHDHMPFGDCPQDVSQQQGLLRNHVVLYRETLNGIDPTNPTGTGSNGWTNTYDCETQAGSFSAGGGDGGIVPSWNGIGSGQLQRSPSAFSGETYRSPIRFWAYTSTVTSTGSNGNDCRPMGEYPDIFRCNVRDLDPGTLVTDDAESFLVKPDYTKTSQTPSTGNAGILIQQRT